MSFELPMNLTDWFPRPRMKTKREEIRKIILKLQEQQNKEKKGQKDPSSMERSLQDKTEQLINSSSDWMFYLLHVSSTIKIEINIFVCPD